MATMKKTYHHGDLATVLTQAVRTLIERDGAAHFSIAEACKMAGVSTAAPYKHFKEKQEILESVAKSGFQDMTEEMIEARDSAGPNEPGRAERIAAIGKAYVGFARKNPGAFRLMFGSSPNVKENDTVHDCGHRCFSILIEEVAAHLGMTPDDDRTKQLSVLLWTFVHGAASLEIDNDYEAADTVIDVDGMVDLATYRLLNTVS
ncbi:MAG: WHG domain-containing protein [Pseudomonadota bacterium]